MLAVPKLKPPAKRVLRLAGSATRQEALDTDIFIKIRPVDPLASRAMRRQFARSAEVPCANRGNQASGTVIVRPSVSSATRASSLTLTL